MRKHLVILVGVLFLVNCKSYSQINNNQGKLSKKQLAEHKTSYSKKMKNLGIAIKPEFFYKYKIDINKVNELKSVGVDIIDLGNKVGEYNYKENSLISDLIIQGTIIEKKYHKNPNDYFHTTYKIKLENVIQGVYKKDYVYVKTVSGLIGEDKFINRSIEPKLYMGEKVVLMLNNIDIKGFEEDKLKGHFTKKMNANSFEFEVLAKYTIKNNHIFDRYKKSIGGREKVYESIKKIQSANSTNNFYLKKFNYEK